MDDRDTVRGHNQVAWDLQVEQGNPWTVPVGAEAVAAARRGELRILLTPCRPVPADWFPALQGIELLCLASGGGQQAPLLAAAGARVTVLDNSPRQLQRDRDVAARESLTIQTVAGDMTRLSMFDDGRFDLVLHPVANCFVSDVRAVWREAYRVLAPGGLLLAGFANPLRYLFDEELAGDTGELRVKHALPYSDLESYPVEQRLRRLEQGEPLEFGHTLEDQIGGQLTAGFLLTAMYEDRYPAREADPLSAFSASFIATRAMKPHTRRA